MTDAMTRAMTGAYIPKRLIKRIEPAHFRVFRLMLSSVFCVMALAVVGLSPRVHAQADTPIAAPTKEQTPTAEPVLRDAGIVLTSVNSRDEFLSEQVEFINQLLRFDQTVTVLTEVEDGPLFDPDTQEIWMPSSFANVIENFFTGDKAPVADVYFHTLVHEVGHVLFSQYDLPLLAREEDAADALANVLLLEFAENGAERVLNAAEMFGLESEEAEWFEESDFWSEHSLDIQRYYATLCHVYGSAPDDHAELVNDEYGLSAERAEGCEYEYQRIREGWLNVLQPYLKR